MAASYVQQMLDNLIKTMNTPSSGEYFLPAFIQKNGYDPYAGSDGNGFHWSVKITDDQFLIIVGKICVDLWNNYSICQDKGKIAIADPDTKPTLELTGCKLVGLSNAYISSAVATGTDTNPDIQMEIDFGHYPTKPDNPSLGPEWSTKAQLTGSFKLTQYCCCTTETPQGTTCDVGTSKPQSGSGTFITTVNQNGSATAWMRISELAPNTLTIVPNPIGTYPPGTTGPAPPPPPVALLFKVPVGPTGGPDVTTTIDITSFPKGTNKESYNNMAMKAFDSPSAQNNILGQINATMNESGNQGLIASLITNSVDKYLHDNKKYPYGPFESVLS